MYPPPTTSSDPGMSGRFNAAVESMTRGSSPPGRRSDAGTAGTDPVARIACSNCTVSSPPDASFTRSVCASSIDASPCRYCTFRLLASSPVPLVRRATTWFLNARSLSRSIVGSPKVMPQAFAWRASATSFATCRSALDGMQPRYTQTPPGLSSGSMRAVLRPRSAARNAAA